MDTNVIRTWDGKVPSFQSPPPVAPRSFCAPQNSQAHSTAGPWRAAQQPPACQQPCRRGRRNRSSRGRGNRGRFARTGRNPPGASTWQQPRPLSNEAAGFPKPTSVSLLDTSAPEVDPTPLPSGASKRGVDLPSVGARLSSFAPAWIGAPSSVRTTVTRGFHWTWLLLPRPLRPPFFTQTRPDLLPVQDWVEKGVIYPVPNQPCFQSRIFTVPRPDCPDGRLPRIIIDLSPLNRSVCSPSFQLDNHSTLARVLIPPAHMAALDISEACTHIPIPQILHRYLTFSYANQLYFFRALPFGLNVAPYIFTKILDWPLRTLHIQGVIILAYLDDIILWHHSPDTLRQHVQLTVDRLSAMGFHLNLAKSQLLPQTSLQWLGVLWHPQTGHWQASQAIRKKRLHRLPASS